MRLFEAMPKEVLPICQPNVIDERNLQKLLMEMYLFEAITKERFQLASINLC